jgi:hypothetical protein
MTAPDSSREGTLPWMSIILVTDRYPTIRQVITRLRQQTVQAQLEIVIVVPAGQPVELDQSALSNFAGVRLVRVSSILPLASARAAGVRAATAPIVAIGETHAFPRPGWAEALIKAHAQPWAVVVPAFDNANPDSALSWAAFLRDYGLWMDGLPAREIGFVPAYNTATKRDVLLGLDGELESMVSRAEDLAKNLRAGGHRSYFEPGAKIDHANISRPKAWLLQRFLIGQVLAAGRAEHWSRPRLLLYACAAPLIPAVILSRLASPVRLMQQRGRLTAGIVLALVFGAVASAAGEMITYILGARPAAKLRVDEYELYKLRYTSLPSE